MSDENPFALIENTISIRGKDVICREITHAERTEVLKRISEDKYSALWMFAVFGSVSPKLTEETVHNTSAEVVAAINKEVRRLSGMTTDDEDNEEQAKVKNV